MISVDDATARKNRKLILASTEVLKILCNFSTCEESESAEKFKGARAKVNYARASGDLPFPKYATTSRLDDVELLMSYDELKNQRGALTVKA